MAPEHRGPMNEAITASAQRQRPVPINSTERIRPGTPDRSDPELPPRLLTDPNCHPTDRFEG